MRQGSLLAFLGSVCVLVMSTEHDTGEVSLLQSESEAPGDGMQWPWPQRTVESWAKHTLKQAKAQRSIRLSAAAATRKAQEIAMAMAEERAKLARQALEEAAHERGESLAEAMDASIATATLKTVGAFVVMRPSVADSSQLPPASTEMVELGESKVKAKFGPGGQVQLVDDSHAVPAATKPAAVRRVSLKESADPVDDTNSSSVVEPVPTLDEQGNTPPTVHPADAQCPLTCATCDVNVFRNGQLACTSCHSAQEGEEGAPERVLVNGECRLCNLPFCGACMMRAVDPPPVAAEADKQQLVCTACQAPAVLVDGRCQMCELANCVACGVRESTPTEMLPDPITGLVSRQRLFCKQCAKDSFSVNGKCEQCDRTKCGSCVVRTRIAPAIQPADNTEQPVAPQDDGVARLLDAARASRELAEARDDETAGKRAEARAAQQGSTVSIEASKELNAALALRVAEREALAGASQEVATRHAVAVAKGESQAKARRGVEREVGMEHGAAADTSDERRDERVLAGLPARRLLADPVEEQDAKAAEEAAEAISKSVDGNTEPVEEATAESGPKAGGPDAADQPEPPSSAAMDAEAEVDGKAAAMKAEQEEAAKATATKKEPTEPQAEEESVEETPDQEQVAQQESPAKEEEQETSQTEDRPQEEAEAKEEATEAKPEEALEGEHPWDAAVDKSVSDAALAGEQKAVQEETQASQDAQAMAAEIKAKAEAEQAAREEAAQKAAAEAQQALVDAQEQQVVQQQAVEEHQSKLQQQAEEESKEHAEQPQVETAEEPASEQGAEPTEPEPSNEEEKEAEDSTPEPKPVEEAEEAEPDTQPVYDATAGQVDRIEELVCASCPEPQLLPDGLSMTPQLYLADGQCVPCDFPHCSKCTSDGMQLHCTECEEPFLAIRTDDPLFHTSGVDASAGQCQPCHGSCLECSGRPHWCSMCDTSSGLAMAARRVVGNRTIGTCVPVHPSCATSNQPALAAGIAFPEGSSANAALSMEASCTSCVEGQGLETLPGSRHTGRCQPCHPSCPSCHLSGEASSCTSCREGDQLEVRDSYNQAGVCTPKDSEPSCPDCISRESAALVCSGSVFVPHVLGDSPATDQGVCAGFTPDCTVQCLPSADASVVPDRRVCSKHCLKKSITTVGDSKKIVVCRVSNSVSCTRGNTAKDATELTVELGDTQEEPQEHCTQEKEASCAAALPFDMKHWVQDELVLIAQAAALSNSSAPKEAPGCATLGRQDTILNACANSLLLF